MAADEQLRDRVVAAMARPPLSEMVQAQRRELADALEEADTVEDLPGKWQAAILQAEQGTYGSRRAHSERCCSE